jgi:hypothetical protein
VMRTGIAICTYLVSQIWRSLLLIRTFVSLSAFCIDHPTSIGLICGTNYMERT